MFGIHAQPGSIPSATLLPEDLLPAYLKALSDLVEEVREAKVDEDQLMAKVHYISRMDSFLGEMEAKVAMGEDYYGQEEAAADDVEYLADELRRFIPPGTTFPVHEGYEADFRFWAVTGPC